MTPPCWSCGAQTHLADELEPWKFTRCVDCGLVQRPARDIGRTYTDGDYEAARMEVYSDHPSRRFDARVRVEFLRRFAPAGRLLDVGTAGGEFVALAGASGYRASGVEPTPGFAQLARDRHGIDVIQGTLADADLADSSLDVATMWHVLEHIPEPRDHLELLHRAMRPGGVLAIEVPNYASQPARRRGQGWSPLEPDVHINQFSPASLRTLLTRSGFSVLATMTVPFTPYMRRRARFRPWHIRARASQAVALRDPRGVHPSGHELLRAVARA